MLRLIQTMIENPLAEGILSKEFNRGSSISIDSDKDGLKLTKTKRATRTSTSSGRTPKTKAKV